MEITREVLCFIVGVAVFVELDAIGRHGGFLGVRQIIGLHEGFRQNAVGVNDAQQMGLDIVVPVFVLHLIEVNVPCRFDCKTCHVGNLLLVGCPYIDFLLLNRLATCPSRNMKIIAIVWTTTI